MLVVLVYSIMTIGLLYGLTNGDKNLKKSLKKIKKDLDT
jgi:hypothetical protein